MIFFPIQKLITNDVTVLLNNDKIEIETVTAEEAAEMISNIAYVKPRSTSTQLTYEPAGSKDRVIEIVTAVRLVYVETYKSFHDYFLKSTVNVCLILKSSDVYPGIYSNIVLDGRL